jgi:nucleoside-diphosphate-sugar epimerase
MRIFVTGASGFIGSAVVPELLQAGHQVAGLARSDASARSIAAAGAEVVRGELADLDVLRTGAAASDGVIHLGFIHDFANFAAAAETDRLAIEALGSALQGTDRPLVVASGLVGLTPGRVATERDVPAAEPGSLVAPRLAGVRAALSFASRGVRTVMVRFAPTVHGEGDHGFIPIVIASAREKGVSGYIGDGSNRWCIASMPHASFAARSSLRRPAVRCTLSGKKACRFARLPR